MLFLFLSSKSSCSQFNIDIVKNRSLEKKQSTVVTCISPNVYVKIFQFIQIRVRARDGGVPFRFNTSVVIVTMQRNFQAPLWSAVSYQETVVETLSLGTVILTVSATDSDPLVCLMSYQELSCTRVS